MKNKLLYIGASVALLLTGCTDLDTDVKSVYEQYPDNEIAQDAVANACYSAAKGDFATPWGIWGLVSYASGENIGVAFSGDYYDGGTNARSTLHANTPDDTNLKFADIQAGITKCNKAILSLQSSDGKITSTIAQLRTMRAFYHYTLLNLFGDVPILDHLYEDTEVVARTERPLVTQWVVTELLSMIPYLPRNVDKATYGKPTVWMAHALLAKIYLNYPVLDTGSMDTSSNPISKLDVNSAWSKYDSKLDSCIMHCDSIINSGLFDLSDDYKAKFRYDNGSQIKDFIFAFPFTASEKDGMVISRYETWRKGQNDGNGGASLYSIALTNSCAGTLPFNPAYADLFNLPYDRRNDCIYGNDEGGIIYQYDSNGEKTTTATFYKGEPVKATKTVSLATLTDDAGNAIPMGPSYDHLDVGATLSGWTQGWRGNKFIMNPSNYNNYSRNDDNDYPVFRFADIILEKCEAMVRRGYSEKNGDTPLSLMNQIREAAKLKTGAWTAFEGNVTLQDILDERGREFFAECSRRDDLLRYGMYENPTWYLNVINTDFANKYKRVFPIPTDVMNSNTNWSQNPSY